MSNIYILNGKNLTDRSQAFNYLGNILFLPSYYHHNLDSLYDCLTDYYNDKTIIIINSDYLSTTPFSKVLLKVFKKASENSTLQLSLVATNF